jgi:hypothetical protein
MGQLDPRPAEKPMVKRVKEMAAEVRQYTHSAPPSGPPSRVRHSFPGITRLVTWTGCTHFRLS